MSMEKYQPTKEEVAKAEDMMSDEQRAMSEKREQELNVEAQESPLELGVKLESLEAENQETFDEILKGYNKLVDSIDERLKDQGTNPEAKRELVKQKKDYQDKVREVQTKYPEFASAGVKEQQQAKAQELIARIPDE